MSDINDIIAQINADKKKLTFYSNTKKTNIEILPLTLSQQKKIMEYSYEGYLAVIYFNSIIYDILKENVQTDAPLDTIDRVCACIALRCHLGKEYQYEGNIIDIEKHIEKNKTIEIDIQPTTISHENIVFNVELPTLETDNKINKLLVTKYNNKKPTTSQLISDLYVYEILKFIKSFTFNEKTINVDNNYTETLKLLYQLDTVYFDKIIEYINEVREKEQLFTNTEDTGVNFSIIPEFFISS